MTLSPFADKAQTVPVHNPSEVFARTQQAFRTGNYAAARKGFEQVFEIDPQSAAAHSNLGVIEMHAHHPDPAIRDLSTAEKLAPHVGGIELDLGLAYYEERKFTAAVPHFERIPEANPRGLQARLVLERVRESDDHSFPLQVGRVQHVVMQPRMAARALPQYLFCCVVNTHR